MMSNVLVLGNNGQVGRALVQLLGSHALAASSSDINLLHENFIGELEKFVAKKPLTAVINAAAYTKVDIAEGEGRQDAFRTNAEAVKELAAWCKKQGLVLVHYSTDYVMDGSGHNARTEDSETNPINAYGQSKLEGEQAIISEGGKYLIFRTSWVYDAEGKNFVNTIRRLIGERESLKVVADQVGAPTYAPHLAHATLDALEKTNGLPQFPSGLYHLCNAGETSWHGFAQAIFMLAREYESREYEGSTKIKCQQVNPIPSSEYPLPAKRPLNSRLDTQKARKILGVSLPHWEAGLRECFEQIYANSGMQASRSKNHTT
jgi:dTDP-4-dehydrorhamnose reductase